MTILSCRAKEITMTDEFGKKTWTDLFIRSGMNDEMMETWHRLFEAEYPNAHQSFLEWLKLTPEEIKAIRQRYAA